MCLVEVVIIVAMLVVDGVCYGGSRGSSDCSGF